VRERDPLGDIGVDGRIILNRVFKTEDGGSLPGFIWLKIGASGGLLGTR
jgi:hypothetical protein